MRCSGAVIFDFEFQVAQKFVKLAPNFNGSNSLDLNGLRLHLPRETPSQSSAIFLPLPRLGHDLSNFTGSVTSKRQLTNVDA